jgi:hypothetical protein
VASIVISRSTFIAALPSVIRWTDYATP